jgi:hypothetical protein
MQPMTQEDLNFMESKFLQSKRILFILLFAFITSFLIISYIFFFYLQINESNWYLKIIPGVILASDIFIIYFVVYPPYQNLRQDFSSKKKEIVNSQIEKTEERQNKNIIRYYWHLKNGYEISVDSSQYSSYKVGEDLCFHIAPSSKTLLSVEKVTQF